MAHPVQPIDPGAPGVSPGGKFYRSPRLCRRVHNSDVQEFVALRYSGPNLWSPCCHNAIAKSPTVNNLTFPIIPDRPHSTVMPLIEELPTTNATRISHGWAYVPDTGPAKAVLPPGGRKRGAARDGAANRADGSAKQAKILQARLADLDKENYKDTTIPIPPRAKEKGSFRVRHF